LHQAAELQRQVLVEVEQVEVGEPLEDKAQALVNLAGLAYEWNDLELAETYAAQALDIGRQLDQEHFLVSSSLILARIKQAKGETAPAQQMLQTLVAQIKQPLLLRQVQAVLARLHLAAGDAAAARRWTTAYAQVDENVPRLQQEQETLLAVRLLIAQGEAEPALALLGSWQAEAETQGRSRSGLEMLVLEALAYSAAGNRSRAVEKLGQALALARSAGYQRLFLDEGAPLAALLKAVSAETPAGDSLDSYIRMLLDGTAEEQEKAKPSFQSIAEQLVEPLSSQEQRVLHLLAAGLSNPEIADEFVVSVNTVKTQVQSIYRKLDVHSREEAGDVARQLNLL
jgi:LuxR family maltose regulon positive regulatory protein